MKYRDATAFRQALQQRLKDRADGDGALLMRNRKHVASIDCLPDCLPSPESSGF